MTVLLDANVLIALTAVGHVHQDRAERWLSGLDEEHATCPITQGALLRVLLHSGAVLGDALAALASVTSHHRHRFWPDDVGFDAVSLAGVVGHRQVTDAYLAGLARHHGGRLATLDAGLAALHPDVATLLPR